MCNPIFNNAGIYAFNML